MSRDALGALALALVLAVWPGRGAGESAPQWERFLENNDAVSGTPDAARVARVGCRLDAAAPRALASVGGDAGEAGAVAERARSWRFALLRDAAREVSARPDGCVLVSTGLVAFVRSDDELAAVLAHAVARAAVAAGAPFDDPRQGAPAPLDILGGEERRDAMLFTEKPWLTRGVLRAVEGVGAPAGDLPPAEDRETEARGEGLGLALMAEAGYDPRAALAVWRRLEREAAAARGFPGARPLVVARRTDLQAHLDEALRRFRAAGGAAPALCAPAP
jgi:hypothetical protein